MLLFNTNVIFEDTSTMPISDSHFNYRLYIYHNIVLYLRLPFDTIVFLTNIHVSLKLKSLISMSLADLKVASWEKDFNQGHSS